MYLSALLIIILIILKQWSDKRSNEPPMLNGALPIIGHGFYLLGNTKEFLRKMIQFGEECTKIGHPVSVRIGYMKVYVLSDPNDCHKVAQNCVEKPKILYKFCKRFFGNGLILSKKSVWSRHRKLINPMFNQRVIDGFIGIFNEQAKLLVVDLGSVQGKGQFDHLTFLKKTTFQSTTATIIGDSRFNNSSQITTYIQALDTLEHNVFERLKRIWLYNDHIYGWSRLKKVENIFVKVLKSFGLQLIEENKRKITNPNHRIDENSKSFMDFFEIIEQKELMTKPEILEEINTLVASAFDTTVLALTYVMLMVASYADVQDRLYEEIKEVCGDCDEISKTDLNQLEYLDAVIKETLRTYPIIPIISRVLDKNITIKNYTLCKGHQCIFLINALHQHPMWSKDAQEFVPERWLNPNTRPQNPGMFAAFGLGRRNCIGKVYAMTYMKIVLVHIIKNYKLFGDRSQLINKYEIVAKPDSGYYISIEKR